ncbi:hypothetical protein FRC17_007651 [Serendipita sp. 399]|nr:hypothetical protein FRC17_007651 [Serendipita sp. 399]
MADIYSPLPANPQIFTSKSRPPFGSAMGVLSRHNQLPNAGVTLPQPVKTMQKRRRSEDSDDDMDQQSRSRSPSPEKRVIAPARSRKLPLKKVRADPEAGNQEKQDGSNGTDSDSELANARVLLEMVQALLEKEPSLTKLLISVIPRPTIDAAREAIVTASKKLRDSIPYSAASSAIASVPASTTARTPYSSGGRNSPSMIGSRLMKEWNAWLDHLDEAVNKTGEMFSGEQARSWIHALDAFAAGGTLSYSSGPGISGSIGFGALSGPGPSMSWGGWGSASFSGGWGSFAPSMPRTAPPANNLPEMKDFRDLWVQKVGWLVGRQPPIPGFEAMDER